MKCWNFVVAHQEKLSGVQIGFFVFEIEKTQNCNWFDVFGHYLNEICMQIWSGCLVDRSVGRPVSRVRQGSHCHAINRRLIFAHSMPIILIQITGIINEPLDVRAMQISLRYTRPSNYGFVQFKRIHLKKFAIKFTEMIKTLSNIQTREMFIILSLSFFFITY